jgi:hypothetical protein
MSTKDSRSICRADIPYPIVSHESVPSLIDNLTKALYGQITKSISNGRIVWSIPCDPNGTASFFGVPRNTGEGLMCYIIRAASAFVGAAPTQNGQLTLQAVSNTQVRISYKGSDGVVRSNTLTLS